MQDAYLPQRLVDKLMYMFNYIEMARVTGVPMSFLLTRGQSIKVFSQILRKARQKNMLVPNIKVRPRRRRSHCSRGGGRKRWHMICSKPALTYSQPKTLDNWLWYSKQ